MIKGGTQSYPYRAMLATLIQNSEEVKSNQLITSGFIKDHAGLFENRENDANLTRKAWTILSISREFIDPLHLDFFQQSKYLINQTDSCIRLTCARSLFSLMTLPADGKAVYQSADIIRQEAIFYVRKVKISSSVINGHTEGLKHRNAVYPI